MYFLESKTRLRQESGFEARVTDVVLPRGD